MYGLIAGGSSFAARDFAQALHDPKITDSKTPAPSGRGGMGKPV